MGTKCDFLYKVVRIPETCSQMFFFVLKHEHHQASEDCKKENFIYIEPTHKGVPVMGRWYRKVVESLKMFYGKQKFDLFMDIDITTY